MTFLRSWVVDENNLNYCCEEEDETQASSTSHKGSKEEKDDEQDKHKDNEEETLEQLKHRGSIMFSDVSNPLENQEETKIDETCKVIG